MKAVPKYSLRRRLVITRRVLFLSESTAIVSAFAVMGIVFVIAGSNPILAYSSLLYGAFGTYANMTEVLTVSAPLILVGIGMTIAFKCKVWNIGGEGQLMSGALGSTAVALMFPDASPYLLAPLAVLAGFGLGAFWAAIPGFLKVRLGLNEIITTLMMNYIMIFIVSWLLHGPWLESPFLPPQTKTLSEASWLPELLPFIVGSRLHVGWLIAITALAFAYFLLDRTKWGYSMRATGISKKAAEYGGISIARAVFLAMILSGGLCGLAGMGEVLGIHHRLRGDISPGYGWTGITVALLGRLNPIGVMVASVLMGAIIVGSTSMQRTTGIVNDAVYAMQGIFLLCVVGASFLAKYEIRRA